MLFPAFDSYKRPTELSAQFEIRVVRGKQQVLAMAGILSAVAARCDQAGVVADLSYFISNLSGWKCHPVLLAFVRHTVEFGQKLTPADVIGAVLVNEYQLCGVPLGVYISADRSGRSTLLGPAHRRLELGAAASQHLLNTGAHAVFLSFRCDADKDRSTPPGLHDGPRGRWATRDRDIPDHLPLEPTFSATLAAIDPQTRTNMQHYRRHAEADLGCSFIPNAGISTADLLALNRQCAHPLSDKAVTLRHASLAQIEHPVLLGLNHRDGHWLSIVALRRVGHDSEILWEMDRDGLPLHSLPLTMRSYIVENEINNGATRLFIHGDSGHRIPHAFTPGTVTDLALIRRSVPAFLIRKLGRRLIQEENDLARILFDPGVRWNSFGHPLALAVPSISSRAAIQQKVDGLRPSADLHSVRLP